MESQQNGVVDVEMSDEEKAEDHSIESRINEVNQIVRTIQTEFLALLALKPALAALKDKGKKKKEGAAAKQRRLLALSELRTRRTNIMKSFLSLKLLNREIRFGVQGVKETTEKQKQLLDSLSLQIKNFDYEKNHLLKEIKICEDYSSTEAIPLIPLEEFLEQAPEELKIDQEADPHRFETNRYNFELQERKRLLAKKKELEEQKLKLQQANQTQANFMASLGGKLRTLYDACEPLQQFLDLPSSVLTPDASSKYLPFPLYTLFHSFLCYFSSNALNLRVLIKGDVSEAERLWKNESHADAPPAKKRKIAAFHSNQEIKEYEEGEVFSDTEQPNPQRDGHEFHPLYVVVKLGDGKDERRGDVELRFRYDADTNLVTAGIYGGNSGPAVLLNLYPDDVGIPTDPPIPSRFGVTYRWAQEISGLHFATSRPPSFDETSKNEEIAVNRKKTENILIQDVLKKIALRRKARSSLRDQLVKLRQNKFIFSVPNSKFPRKPRCRLEGFTSMNFDEFKKNVPSALKRMECNYFQFILKRGAVELRSFVEVTPEYPLRPSKFHLKLKHSVKPFEPNDLVERTADKQAVQMAKQKVPVYDNMTTELQNEVNNKYSALISGESDNLLLSYQVRHLQTCFDLCQDKRKSLNEFEQQLQRQQGRVVRGRDRIMMFK